MFAQAQKPMTISKLNLYLLVNVENVYSEVNHKKGVGCPLILMQINIQNTHIYKYKIHLNINNSDTRGKNNF